MGKIIIEAYGKVIYEKELPDNVCFAIMKDREDRDKEYEFKKNITRKSLQDPEDVAAV